MSTARLILAAAFMVTACSPKADSGAAADSAAPAAMAAPDDAAIRASIEAMTPQFIDAMKKGDAPTSASFYAEDGLSMAPNVEPASGRPAIEKGFTEYFKAVGKITDFAVQIKEFEVHGDKAYELGTYTMTFQPTGAKAPAQDHGSYFNIWKKQADGSWKIQRDLIVSATKMM